MLWLKLTNTESYVTIRKGLRTIKSSDVYFIDDSVFIYQQNYHKVVSFVFFFMLGE